MLMLPNPIQSAAAARPEHIVLHAGVATYTARALRDAVVQRAAFFAQHDIAAGDVVALWGLADASFVINLHALGWLGAAVAPMPIKAPPNDRVRHLRVTGASVVVVGPCADKGQTHAEITAAFNTGVRLVHTPVPHLTDRQTAAGFDSGSGAHAFAASGPEPAERFWPADETRLIVLSSGSTGAPQPVRLSTTQLFFSAAGSATRLGHHVDDCWLLCLPLHHVGGLSILFRAAFFGACVDMLPRFEPHAVAHKLSCGQVSLVSFVPQMLARMLDVIDGEHADAPHTVANLQRDEDGVDGNKGCRTEAQGSSPAPWTPHPKLRAILLGGAPTSQALLARGLAKKLPLCVTWGMTESASQVATSWPGDWVQPGDCGPPLPFARVGVASRNGNASGPLVICGPVVGAAVLTTQDWGHLTAAGRVVVCGRIDDIMISGGENIAPFEIESVLLAHPQIVDAAVVGFEDATWGQRPVAYVVGSHQAPFDATLATWCRARLAPFKVPAQFIWCKGLPRDALGKLRRTELLASVLQGVEDV